MSLRDEMRRPKSAPRLFVKQHLPNVAALRPAWKAALDGATTMRQADLGGHWGTVGGAIDYRLRYYFAQEGNTRPHLVGEDGAKMLASSAALVRPRPAPPDWQRLADDFFESLATVVADLRPGERLSKRDEDDVARYCIILALFEQMARSGIHMRSPLFELRRKAMLASLLSLAQSVWLDDMRAMSWAFADRHAGNWCSLPGISLNPVFDGSADIGGADADLIVNGCLIDIKATVTPGLDSEIVYQLFGYVMLDYSDRSAIDSAAFYLARQGVMVRWPLDEALAAMAGGRIDLARLRSDFKALLDTGVCRLRARLTSV